MYGAWKNCYVDKKRECQCSSVFIRADLQWFRGLHYVLFCESPTLNKIDGVLKLRDLLRCTVSAKLFGTVFRRFGTILVDPSVYVGKQMNGKLGVLCYTVHLTCHFVVKERGIMLTPSAVLCLAQVLLLPLKCRCYQGYFQCWHQQLNLFVLQASPSLSRDYARPLFHIGRMRASRMRQDVRRSTFRYRCSV